MFVNKSIITNFKFLTSPPRFNIAPLAVYFERKHKNRFEHDVQQQHTTIEMFTGNIGNAFGTLYEELVVGANNNAKSTFAPHFD